MSSLPTSPLIPLHLPPPGSLLSSYDRHVSPGAHSPSIPRLFLDAMSIRETVFCNEQAVPLENEFDDDDQRSHHWVVYHTPSSSSVASSPALPVGTIRLVPPPHPNDSAAHGSEVYIKLGRLAVLPAFRKGGIAKPLLDAALEFAARNPGLFGSEWRGLVLVHAQAPLERYYGRWGFVKDEGMGLWDEEGIMHVGMWKRVDADGDDKKVD